eukprot:783672-Prymnesium_polylepis.1
MKPVVTDGDGSGDPSDPAARWVVGCHGRCPCWLVRDGQMMADDEGLMMKQSPSAHDETRQQPGSSQTTPSESAETMPIHHPDSQTAARSPRKPCVYAYTAS